MLPFSFGCFLHFAEAFQFDEVPMVLFHFAFSSLAFGDVSREEGQDGGRVGSPNHLSPPNYLDNLQIIGLRFKERTAETLQ